ncbi:hypothetical protein [Flaviflagellibacter deserti]|uniref:CopG family transcriptional regulator n=1 Tax=Flaviflagellibacter deserti TaxID=2267266 RepID=A0ABV9Z316_9HYPH
MTHVQSSKPNIRLETKITVRVPNWLVEAAKQDRLKTTVPLSVVVRQALIARFGDRGGSSTPT